MRKFNLILSVMLAVCLLAGCEKAPGEAVTSSDVTDISKMTAKELWLKSDEVMNALDSYESEETVTMKTTIAGIESVTYSEAVFKISDANGNNMKYSSKDIVTQDGNITNYELIYGNGYAYMSDSNGSFKSVKSSDEFMAYISEKHSSSNYSAEDFASVEFEEYEQENAKKIIFSEPSEELVASMLNDLGAAAMKLSGDFDYGGYVIIDTTNFRCIEYGYNFSLDGAVNGYLDISMSQDGKAVVSRFNEITDILLPEESDKYLEVSDITLVEALGEIQNSIMFDTNYIYSEIMDIDLKMDGATQNIFYKNQLTKSTDTGKVLISLTNDITIGTEFLKHGFYYNGENLEYYVNNEYVEKFELTEEQAAMSYSPVPCFTAASAELTSVSADRADGKVTVKIELSDAGAVKLGNQMMSMLIGAQSDVFGAGTDVSIERYEGTVIYDEVSKEYISSFVDFKFTFSDDNLGTVVLQAKIDSNITQRGSGIKVDFPTQAF